MPCPICKKEGVKEYTPFCSDRCAKIDLGRWFNGSYAIPTEEPVDISDNDDDEDYTLPY